MGATLIYHKTTRSVNPRKIVIIFYSMLGVVKIILISFYNYSKVTYNNYYCSTAVLGLVTHQDGTTCLMENISVMLVLITCTAGKQVEMHNSINKYYCLVGL